MKTKTIYTFAAAILLSAGIAVAQTPVQPAPGTNSNTTPAYGSKITNTAIPDPLRSTLQGSQYKGWENGTMYFNQSTNQYSLQMPAPVGKTTSTNPISPSPSTPMSTTTTQPPAGTAVTPNPMGGLQTQPLQTQPQPGSPMTQPATIYRFDQNGKLIPQN